MSRLLDELRAEAQWVNEDLASVEAREKRCRDALSFLREVLSEAQQRRFKLDARGQSIREDIGRCVGEAHAPEGAGMSEVQEAYGSWPVDGKER